MPKRAYQLLLVEDSLVDADLVVRELSQGERVPAAHRVDTLDALRAALDRPWDIVIADEALPGFNAEQTLKLVLSLQPDSPVIIVSGVLDEESAVTHLRAGARDFVTKQRLSRLNAAVARESRPRARRSGPTRAGGHQPRSQRPRRDARRRTLILRTRRREGDEPSALIEVVDTGTGMDESVQKHLFEPFFTTKEVGKGTGLGLATVLGIVEQSGGSVSVETSSGLGSTFTVALPCVEGAKCPMSVAPVTTDKGGSERIIVVEDDPSLGSMVKRMLEARGYEITVANTPLEALALVQIEGFDLLVTDVVMPEMNGRQLAKRVGAYAPDIRVLFMSGYSEDELLARGVIDKHLRFLPKPFSVDQLGREVRLALDASTRSSVAPPEPGDLPDRVLPVPSNP